MASSVSGTKVMWELKPCKRKHVGKEQWEHFLSHGPARGGGGLTAAFGARPPALRPRGHLWSPLEANAGLGETTSGIWTACPWALRSQY